MLASIFSKTRPINYIILTLLVSVSYVLLVFLDEQPTLNAFGIIKKVGVFVLVLLMVYLSQFIVSRNRMVNDNAYVPLLFVSFLLLFPSSLANTKIVVSAFFVMLALRRIFSLHSLKHSKEKIFDASLWIFIASLFHFWSVLFIIPLFIAITFFGAKDYRNWIIPGIAFFVVMTLLAVYLAINNENYFAWLEHKSRVSFDFMYFENVYQNAALAIFVSIAALYFTTQCLALKSKAYNMQSTYKKMILSVLIGVAVFVLSADKDNSILLFTFFPLAVLGANYIESIDQNWRREVNVFSIVSLGIISFVLQLLW